ncbi:hypothetical protein [Sphingomonas sp. RT2P30]|uniref:hypothetical protein n=1 Tax=Parasphingomonas halimpatiens TaxID=3096162 RepID=UPI002FCA8C81
MAVRPQPEFRISLTLAVSDAQALWTAAAAKMLGSPGMTLDDVLDVIGPREDPSITECVAAIANPATLPGCVLDDFWIDGLRGCPPRTDASAGALEQRLVSGETPLRRPPSAHRARARLRLCAVDPAATTAPIN